MLQIFKKEQIALNRLYKKVNANNVLVFPFSISRPVSKTKFDELPYASVNIDKLSPFGDGGYITTCVNYDSHRSSDYKNNIVICILLTNLKVGPNFIGDVVAIPMIDFTNGNFEEVVGYTSNSNMAVSSSDIENLLSK